MDFAFEDLDVYKKAVTWAMTAETLAKALRSQASPPLLDQLVRAALSIPLNIAEGNGRWHKAEKAGLRVVLLSNAFRSFKCSGRTTS